MGLFDIFKQKNKRDKNTFVANVLDPLQGISSLEMLDGVSWRGFWYKKEIIAETEEERKYYASKVDSETNELYFMILYKDGEPETYCCDKNMFFTTYYMLL